MDKLIEDAKAAGFNEVNNYIYVAGKKFINDELAKFAALQKPQWISVKDRLPEYVVFEPEDTKNGFRCGALSISDICWIVVDGKVTESKLILNSDYSDKPHWSMIKNKVTHWMYQNKPEPPINTEVT